MDCARFRGHLLSLESLEEGERFRSLHISTKKSPGALRYAQTADFRGCPSVQTCLSVAKMIILRTSSAVLPILRTSCSILLQGTQNSDFHTYYHNNQKLRKNGPISLGTRIEQFSNAHFASRVKFLEVNEHLKIVRSESPKRLVHFCVVFDCYDNRCENHCFVFLE